MWAPAVAASRAIVLVAMITFSRTGARASPSFSSLSP